MDPIIKVENLSKKYQIFRHKEGLIYSAHDNFRDQLIDIVKKPFQWLSGRSINKEDIWVLKDINFEVEPGEILGIIGPNGAGKSTLLKILTRITQPTQGRAVINGRVSSLLEVTAGFHPELTGKENIYFNGAILGMKRKEIDKKFDKIVEFAGVRKFLNTPVKRYSSGMTVRLAFSVAAHLEPDILLIDEILSVGDAAFQKKSLDRMKEVTKQGERTILFVSHNMEAVQGLCKRTILLDKGEIIKIGPTKEVVRKYLDSKNTSLAERAWEDIHQAPGDDVIRLKAVKVKDKLGQISENIDIRDPVFIEVAYWNLKPGPQRVAGLHFYNEEGTHLFTSYDLHNLDWRKEIIKTGLVKSICKVPGNLLAEGRIFVSIVVNTYLFVSLEHASANNVVSFNVFDSFNGDSVRGDFNAPWPGLVRPMLEWENIFEEKEVKII